MARNSWRSKRVRMASKRLRLMRLSRKVHRRRGPGHKEAGRQLRSPLLPQGNTTRNGLCRFQTERARNASIGTGMVEESSKASAPRPQKPNLARKGRKTRFSLVMNLARNAFKLVPFHPVIRLNLSTHCTGPNRQQELRRNERIGLERTRVGAAGRCVCARGKPLRKTDALQPSANQHERARAAARIQWGDQPGRGRTDPREIRA